MSAKSNWDCHDWRDWMYSQSEDGVVTELQCQFNELTQAQARIKELEGLVREMGRSLQMHREFLFHDHSYGKLRDLHDETSQLLSIPKVRAIMEEKI